MERRPYALDDDVEATGARLGKGAFANVKLVQHRPTGKNLALKVIDLTNSGDYAGESAQIMTECQVHKSLSHPNIIYLYDYSRQERKINLLLEYASKGDFYKFLQSRKKITEEEALRVVFQLAQGLKYLHSLDIIHRDLKLENVLIMEDGRFKLCDFGWCSPPGDTNRNILCGTYEYMAPEVAKRQRYTSKVDMWSLGILAYELVHSFSPFAAPDPKAILKNIALGEFDVEASLSTSYQQMLKSLIEFDPQKRLSAEQLLRLPQFACMEQDFVGTRMSVRPSYRPSMFPGANQQYEDPFESEAGQPAEMNQSVYLGPAPSFTPVPTSGMGRPPAEDFTQHYAGPPLELAAEEHFDLRDLQQFVVLDLDIGSMKDALGEGLKAAGGLLEDFAAFFRDMIDRLDDDKTNAKRARKKRDEVGNKYGHKAVKVQPHTSEKRNALAQVAKEQLDRGGVYANFGQPHHAPAFERQASEGFGKRDSGSTMDSKRGIDGIQRGAVGGGELRRAQTEVQRPPPKPDLPWWQEMFGFLGSGENDELKEKLKQKALEAETEREMKRRDRGGEYNR